MVSDSPTPGRCNEPAGENKNGYCENYPVTDDDGNEKTGRCRMHFGHGRDGNGAPEGNGNAITHGAYASPTNLSNHLDENALHFVESLLKGYLNIAPFGPGDPRVERLKRNCIMIYQEWQAGNTILDDGQSEEVVVGVNEKTGRPIVRDDEHHLSKREERLNTKIRQNLKELGCMPGAGAGTESETVAQIFKAAVERAKNQEAEGGESTAADRDGGGDPETIPAEGGEV